MLIVVRKEERKCEPYFSGRAKTIFVKNASLLTGTVGCVDLVCCYFVYSFAVQARDISQYDKGARLPTLPEATSPLTLLAISGSGER